jgi:hypothetical protein
VRQIRMKPCASFWAKLPMLDSRFRIVSAWTLCRHAMKAFARTKFSTNESNWAGQDRIGNILRHRGCRYEPNYFNLISLRPMLLVHHLVPYRNRARRRRVGSQVKAAKLEHTARWLCKKPTAPQPHSKVHCRPRCPVASNDESSSLIPRCFL